MALATTLTLATFGIVTPLDREMDQWFETHEYQAVPKQRVTELHDWEHEALDALHINSLID